MSADGAQLLLISHYSLLIDLRLLGMTWFTLHVTLLRIRIGNTIGSTIGNKCTTNSYKYEKWSDLLEKGLLATAYS